MKQRQIKAENPHTICRVEVQYAKIRFIISSSSHVCRIHQHL
jgi:hypothetical protein